MKQTTVYMMCGLPGAGKSTYVKEHYPNLPVVSRDIVRAALGFTIGKKAWVLRFIQLLVSHFLLALLLV